MGTMGRIMGNNGHSPKTWQGIKSGGRRPGAGAKSAGRRLALSLYALHLHVRVPPVSVVLGADDPAGRPIGLGSDNLACLQEAGIAPKLGLVHAEWPLLLRNGVLNAGTHAIFL